MRTPIIAIIALNLAACGADRSSGQPWFVDETADVVTVAGAVRASVAQASQWEHENVSDHGTKRTELTFGAAQKLQVFVDDYDLFREEMPQLNLEATGTWSVGMRGVVTLDWSDDGGFVEERTWAPVSAEFAEQLRAPDSHDRGAWPSTGYLAQNGAQTVFHHRFWKREGESEQGGADATLRLSSSPTELAAGAPCGLQIEMEVAHRGETGSEEFEFECEVDEEDGFFRIRAVDLPADDPHVSDWERELDARGVSDRYEYSVYAAFRDAAIPLLWFDPASPHVLVTAGYSETWAGFETVDH